MLDCWISSISLTDGDVDGDLGLMEFLLNPGPK